MKRMSEVLCRPLPISADELLHVFINETSIKDDAAVAHAINHVDALADALQFLLDEYIALANSGDAGNWSAEETPEGIKAIAALSSYRGGK